MAGPRQKKPTITVVTQGGATIRNDKQAYSNMWDSRVRMTVKRPPPFSLQKEKEIFFEAHDEFMQKHKRALTSAPPPIFDEGIVYDMPP